MLITTGGVLIRTRVREIHELSAERRRATLIALDEGKSWPAWKRWSRPKTKRDANGDGTARIVG